VDPNRTVIGISTTDPLGDETWSGCEHVIREFERAWREGAAPTIEEVWQRAERRLTARELVHVDLEFPSRSASADRAYLARFGPGRRTRRRLELIASEYEPRRRRTRADEYARFPDYQAFAERCGGSAGRLPNRADGPGI
jgi:hypothetical protein